MGTKRVWLRSFLIVLAVSLMLARLGPFGTFVDLPLAARLSYWVGLTLLLWLQMEVAAHLLRTVPRSAGWPWAAVAIVAALIGAIPSAFQVAWAESLLRVERDLGPLDILGIYGDVALIALGLGLLLGWVRNRSGLRAPALLDSETVAAGAPDRLLGALPVERRGALLALAAEDHYLRVYTDRGEALILMRFGDALAQSSARHGVRVHRSWWVSHDAVTAAERDGERLTLLLSNGTRVPVSRTYQLAARQAFAALVS